MSRSMPDPDTSSVADAHDALSSRLSVSTPATPAHTSSTQRPYTPTGTRPDPDGMRRISLYVSAEAAEALDAAVDQVQAQLGEDTPRHVALSALLQAGADQAEPVGRQLVHHRAEQLRQRLAELE